MYCCIVPDFPVDSHIIMVNIIIVTVAFVVFCNVWDYKFSLLFFCFNNLHRWPEASFSSQQNDPTVHSHQILWVVEPLSISLMTLK